MRRRPVYLLTGLLVLLLLALAAPLTAAAAPETPSLAITGFSFQGLTPAAVGEIHQARHEIDVFVPTGTDLKHVVATFTINGAKLGVRDLVNGSPYFRDQTSGVSRNDFTHPVTYRVFEHKNATGDRVDYVVTVKRLPHKALTAFSFQGLTPPVVGDIHNVARTIALTVPWTADVKGLVATFATTGVRVTVGDVTQVSGTTANDFTSPVTYTVHADDGTSWNYVVTVSRFAPRAITAFSFQGLKPPVTGVVHAATHRITLTVPYLTKVDELVATFTTTGSAVTVGDVIQESGTTANDFTHPVTYTVHAVDGTWGQYLVTVKVVAPEIGDKLGGGVVAYIFQPGDHGYVEGQWHGLIAARVDQNEKATKGVKGVPWANGDHPLAGPTGTALGTGARNTAEIVKAMGDAPLASYAAGLATSYRGGGYDDWFLPSKAEARKLVAANQYLGPRSGWYWTSSEDRDKLKEAWSERLTKYEGMTFPKYAGAGLVRAVRYF